MTDKNIRRLRNKINFFKKNEELVEWAFSKKFAEQCGSKLTIKLLVETARQEIGYSKKTSSCDIFWSLFCTYLQERWGKTPKEFAQLKKPREIYEFRTSGKK